MLTSSKLRCLVNIPVSRYDAEGEVWRATNVFDKDFSATSHASEYGLALGTHLWTIHNDTKSCSSNGTYSAWLTLTGCSEEEFTCGDGSCLEMAQRCDGRRQCTGGADEQGCTLVSPATGYDMFLTPPPIPPSDTLRVNMTLDIIDIVNIDQVKGLFYTLISVRTLWFDSELIYINLKEESQRNVLNEESKLLWSPSIVYAPVENTEKIKAMQDFTSWKVVATNTSDYTLMEETETMNGFKYSGSTNRQDLTIQNSIEWICHFDLFWYPFDTQSCSLKFYIQQDYADLHPDMIVYSGPMQLTQFNIKNFTICSALVRDRRGVEATVIFGRPLVSNMLTVFIPTLILLCISHIANEFDKEYLDMVIGVNLTVLLVLASL